VTGPVGYDDLRAQIVVSVDDKDTLRELAG
jgi:hypothetical protein